MSIILSILQRVLVREFYRANAGLFFLVIGIGAGFMRSNEHIALAEFFSASPTLMLVPILVWTIYTLNVMKFNHDILKRKENEFIFHITLLPPLQKWFGLLVTLLYQLLPAILYGMFLMVFAIKNDFIATLLVIIASLFLLIFIGSFALSYALHNPNQEKKIGVLTKFLNVSFTKPYPLFFPEWIARREPLMLFGTKIFSCLILLGVTQLYKTDVYDLRLLGLGIVIAFSAQVVLVCEIHRFDNFHFTLNRNLPIPFVQRLLYFFCTLLVLIIPELGMIVKNYPAEFDMWSLISSITFALSIPIFFYGLLYSKDRDQEKFMPFVFFFAISWILLVLFKIPLWVIASVDVAVGLICLKNFYYSFEYISKPES
jgi:hypothetical protein